MQNPARSRTTAPSAMTPIPISSRAATEGLIHRRTKGTRGAAAPAAPGVRPTLSAMATYAARRGDHTRRARRRATNSEARRAPFRAATSRAARGPADRADRRRRLSAGPAADLDRARGSGRLDCRCNRCRRYRRSPQSGPDRRGRDRAERRNYAIARRRPRPGAVGKCDASSPKGPGSLNPTGISP